MATTKTKGAVADAHGVIGSAGPAVNGVSCGRDGLVVLPAFAGCEDGLVRAFAM